MNITTPDQDKLDQIKSKIKLAGLQNLHTLSDFDRTLTYGAVNGVKTPSIISMLRDGDHLSADYTEKAHALFDKYHPTESDPTIPFEEKKKLMREWWDTHNKLLVESGLSKSDLEDIIKNGHVKFREGVGEFLDFLHDHNVPLVVMSASGCGDAIQLFFKKINRDYPNIFYVINRFNWDENGKAISPKEPVIHSLNKDEMVLKNIPKIYDAVKDRKNVILLGDSVDDLGMVEGFDYDNLIKIGFLNSDSDKLLENYKKSFDIVLEGDGDFVFVNQILKELE